MGFFTPKNVTIPIAVARFRTSFIRRPGPGAERAYPNLIHYNKLQKGRHFAAWEQPELLTQELRTALRSLR